MSVLSAPVAPNSADADKNGMPSNVRINPQPIVTAETLQNLNATFLNDLHRLRKSYFVRPADDVKPKTLGDKILNALRMFGHAVRSPIYGSQNTRELLSRRSADLMNATNNSRNIECTSEEYQKIQEQILKNFEETGKFLPSAKVDDKTILNDCLKFYKDLTKNLKIAEKYHDLRHRLLDVETVVQQGKTPKEYKIVFAENFLETAQKDLKKELDALEKQLPLPSETKTAPAVATPSKGMFGKVKPLFERSDAYGYYDNERSTENVFPEEQLQTLFELQTNIKALIP